MYPVIGNAIIFGIMSITVETSLGGSDYFWLTLILLVLTGATTSFFQVSVFAEASRFPPQYVQAVMSGQGIAGVAVAGSSIISALAATTKMDTNDPSSINRSAFIYFLSALFVTVAALLGRVILSQQAFYLFQMKQEKLVISDDEDSESSQHTTTRPVKQLVKKSMGLIFAVAYVFVVTLMIFPSITALIKSVVRHPPSSDNTSPTRTTTTSQSRFFDDDIFIAMHFLLFNVGDWVGRVLPLWSSFQTFKSSLLVIFSLLRTGLIPLFLICNVVVSRERLLPVLINSDLAYFLLIWIFSVTNGWVSSLSMMAAPQQTYLRSAAEKSQIGSIMSFALVVGLAIGGCMSFWIRTLI
ncbi:equilibrative nucleoside transporter [Halteromyces radiatus]|uniref:equilibrative nucleoside transporter n=1 Tax=Halteromyces radiatus TaxID=101107 RepID=UPI00221F9D64|nr:equilibrative nucleoside transporter [Halteromyces radiatus]KAI8078663.1 equilibrative nucleoside transporter [Halteromyces radiatus]